MRWILVVVVLALFAHPARAQTTLYFSPDAPFDPGGAGFLEPWQIVEHVAGSYTVTLNVPGLRHIDAVDAVHKMDRPDNWLFSVGVPADIAGVPVERRDVVRFDGAAYSVFFRGGAVTGAIPTNNGIDALYLEDSDVGDLIVSFLATVELPAGSGVIHEPADLVRYSRTGPGVADWAFSGIVFDASSAGAGIPGRLNVIGADRNRSMTLLVLDNPARLEPSSGPTIYERGQVIAWDGSSFGLLDTLVGWPGNRRIDALSCQRAPGEVLGLTMERLSIAGDLLRLNWAASCNSGAEDYGIYEGTLRSFFGHVLRDCVDDGADFTEDLQTSSGDTYYLVVPHNRSFEGSYGETRIAGTSIQRPQPLDPADRCRVDQWITACPP